MKYFTASIVIVLLLAFLVNAQSTPPRKFKHGGKIVARYDKATNLTSVLLESYTLKNSANGPFDEVNAIELIAGFTYSGAGAVGNPKVIELVLEISRLKPRSKKAEIKELTAEIEKQLIDLGKPIFIDSTTEHLKEDLQGLGTVRIDIYKEKLGVLIPVDVFRKLAAAKTVKLETGDVKVTLRDKQLEAFRDLASRIQ